MLTLDSIEKEIETLVERGNSRQDVACLADLLICRDALRDRPSAQIIKADGSEFAQCINGKCLSDILPCMIELMETLKVLNPRLYESVIRRL